MKEIAFSEFRVKCSAVLDQVRKTRQPIRVIRFGVALADVVPLSQGKKEVGAKALRKDSPRPSKASPGRGRAAISLTSRRHD